MPAMSGYEVSGKIREHALKGAAGDAAGANAARVPIVAMTANAMTGDREKCMEAGADDHTAKPVVRHSLLEMVIIRKNGKEIAFAGGVFVGKGGMIL